MGLPKLQRNSSLQTAICLVFETSLELLLTVRRNSHDDREKVMYVSLTAQEWVKKLRGTVVIFFGFAAKGHSYYKKI